MHRVADAGERVPSSGVGTRTILAKWKGTKIGGTKAAGSCNMLQQSTWAAKLKPKFNWSALPVTLKGTKVSGVSVSVGQVNGESNITFHGLTKGSFVGHVTLSDSFDATSTAELNACFNDEGTVSTLTTDPTNSTITVGVVGP